MEQLPKISVVVPVYKAEKFLHSCVESILAQTFENFELLLVDDGSPDNSGKICDEYAKNDGRVQVFHIANGGANRARALGVAHAKGEYVTFVDSDDSLPPMHCMNCMATLMNNATLSSVPMTGIPNNIPMSSLTNSNW